MLLTTDPPSSASVSANLSPFSVADLYSVCVRGTDGFGNTGPDSCVRLPVYNAAGEWITGGGRMIVPPNAYDSNPTPATFHFKAKYASGASAPSGDLELRGVGNGNLHFESTSLDWLVLISAQRGAVIRGKGRLNASYDCAFEAEAWADSYQPGDRQRMGLRIFDCTGGGGGLNLGPTEVQGSIVIHR